MEILCARSTRAVGDRRSGGMRRARNSRGRQGGGSDRGRAGVWMRDPLVPGWARSGGGGRHAGRDRQRLVARWQRELSGGLAARGFGWRLQGDPWWSGLVGVRVCR